MRTWATLVTFTVSLLLLPDAIAEQITLVEKGREPLFLVIPDNASDSIRSTARSLAETLQRISGAEFPVKTEATGKAIRLLIAEGPEPGALERERYTIRSGENGLILTGATDLALRHAAWDLLHRFGYRQFFPGKTWEVVPRRETLRIDLDITESPDYASRRIWYGYGFWDHNREAWEDWVEKNRAGGGFALNTGHAYGRLIRSQQDTFDAHPEYYALLNGQRNVVPSAKLCIGNPGVRDAAIAYALEHFAENPDADCVSLDPSDGGGWCECQACAAIGPPSDRALFLANTVAEAVVKTHGPNRYVGMYAYSYHSEPPSLDVHPNVIISVATAFIKGGRSLDDLLDGWAARGATLGIREYYSVNTWDRDLPGAARGSRLDYLAETISAFHTADARFLSAESSDNWGCNGLGYYLASRLLWDIDEAANQEAITGDFLDKAFGPAREPMERFYTLIDGSNRQAQLVFDDLLARMFRTLGEARELASAKPKVRKRIDDLVLYTRHAELFDRYRNARGAERQTAYEAMIRHAYRIRGTFMVHSYALYRDVANRDKSVRYPENAHWKIPEAANPWKSSKPFPEAEIEDLIASGIANHTPVELDFEPVEFDDRKLAPASSVIESPLPDLPPGKAGNARGERSWFTVVETVPATLELRITGGLIAHYRDRGNVKVQLWKIGGPSQTGEDRTLVAEDASVPPDGEERIIKMTVEEPGVYRINLNDGRDLTRVTWPEGQLMSWKMALDDFPNSLSGRWNLYAWVPRGTRKIGLYSDAAGGELQNPNGETVLDLTTDGGDFLSAEVPEGMDGCFWKFHHVAGRVSLLTIPPYLARSPAEMVIPTE